MQGDVEVHWLCTDVGGPLVRAQCGAYSWQLLLLPIPSWTAGLLNGAKGIVLVRFYPCHNKAPMLCLVSTGPLSMLAVLALLRKPSAIVMKPLHDS